MKKKKRKKKLLMAPPRGIVTHCWRLDIDRRNGNSYVHLFMLYFFYSYTYKRFHYVTLVIQTTPTAVFRGCWTDGVRLEGRDMNNHEHHCSAMPAPYSFMGVFAHLSRA